MLAAGMAPRAGGEKGSGSLESEAGPAGLKGFFRVGCLTRPGWQQNHLQSTSPADFPLCYLHAAFPALDYTLHFHPPPSYLCSGSMAGVMEGSGAGLPCSKVPGPLPTEGQPPPASCRRLN
jgi:hypothetical protein